MQKEYTLLVIILATFAEEVRVASTHMLPLLSIPPNPRGSTCLRKPPRTAPACRSPRHRLPLSAALPSHSARSAPPRARLIEISPVAPSPSFLRPTPPGTSPGEHRRPPPSGQYFPAFRWHHDTSQTYL